MEAKLDNQGQDRLRAYIAPLLLDEHELTSKGIRPKSRVQRWRLIRAGKFPKPIKIGARNFWIESEVDAFEAARIAAAITERDGVRL